MIARIHGVAFSVLLQIHGSESQINSKLHEVALNILSDRADTLKKSRDEKTLQASKGRREALAAWFGECTPYLVSFLHLPKTGAGPSLLR